MEGIAARGFAIVLDVYCAIQPLAISLVNQGGELKANLTYIW